MKTYKIGLMSPGHSPSVSARIFNEKKAKVLDEAYNDVLPKWFLYLSKKFPILGKFVRVHIRYASMKKEIIEIRFIGKKMEEITFIYF